MEDIVIELDDIPSSPSELLLELAHTRREAMELKNALSKLTTGWKPIDTAPKDGTRIIGINPIGQVRECMFLKHSHVPLYGWVYQPDYEEWNVDGFDPVYWMPLPEPPKGD